jgi:hypothetical protein
VNLLPGSNPCAGDVVTVTIPVATELKANEVIPTPFDDKTAVATLPFVF